MSSAFIALVRTHHITSRKKIAALRKAANKYSCYVLLRSGGSPGIMYCEGEESEVNEWIARVQRLRYKDYQLAAKPQNSVSVAEKGLGISKRKGLYEVESVKDFGSQMSELGLSSWWRKAMGFAHD